MHVFVLGAKGFANGGDNYLSKSVAFLLVGDPRFCIHFQTREDSLGAKVGVKIVRGLRVY